MENKEKMKREISDELCRLIEETMVSNPNCPEEILAGLRVAQAVRTLHETSYELIDLCRELVDAEDVAPYKGRRRTVEGTFASAAGGRGSEQKGVAAVAKCEGAKATDVRRGNGNRDAGPYKGAGTKKAKRKGASRGGLPACDTPNMRAESGGTLLLLLL